MDKVRSCATARRGYTNDDGGEVDFGFFASESVPYLEGDGLR